MTLGFHLPQILALRTALIVIDVQNDFCHDEGVISRVKGLHMAPVQKAVSSLLPFTDRCREFSLAVIFVRTTHSDWTNSASWLGRVGGEIGPMHIFDAAEHNATLVNMRKYFGAAATSAEALNLLQQAQPGEAKVEGE
jgi:hypothetical protein